MMFKTRKVLKEEISNAEARALAHFKKIFQIEQIIKKSDESKEIYAITIEKIKKVIK